MCLIDHPQVSIKTIEKLVETYIKTFSGQSLGGPADVVLPEYKGRGGHPVIFSRSVFDKILNAPLNKGARSVVRDRKSNVVRVKVNDKYIRQDIDTNKEYKGIEPKE